MACCPKLIILCDPLAENTVFIMSLSKPSTSGEIIYTHEILHKQVRAISNEEVCSNINFADVRS